MITIIIIIIILLTRYLKLTKKLKTDKCNNTFNIHIFSAVSMLLDGREKDEYDVMLGHVIMTWC